MSEKWFSLGKAGLSQSESLEHRLRSRVVHKKNSIHILRLKSDFGDCGGGHLLQGEA